MRVAMIVWNEFLNDARVRKEAETLQKTGRYSLTVFALHTPGRTRKDELYASGIRVLRTARRPFMRSEASAGIVSSQVASAELPRWRMLRMTSKILSRAWTHAVIITRVVLSRPEVIHAHDVNTLPSAWLAAILSGARLVYDAHEISTDREGYSDVRGLVGWVEKRLMPRADAAITTTEARAKFFARAYGVPRPVVLQNRPRFSTARRTDRIRRELGLQDHWPIVIYQGGLQQGRGLENLVAAAAKIQDAHFVFVGGGRLANRLELQVQTMGLGKRVHFIPTVSLDDLPSYTASADIGVQPIENTCLNHFTTDSNKLFEYMMAGLPVVASDLPEIRRIVAGREFGLLVPAGSQDHLTQALQTLVSDSAKRSQFAENARRAARTLNWDEQEQKLLDLYRGLER